MGAVPSFCGANHRSFIIRKLLGTAPDEPGDSPEFIDSHAEYLQFNQTIYPQVFPSTAHMPQRYPAPYWPEALPQYPAATGNSETP